MDSLIKTTVKVNGIGKDVLFFSNSNTTICRYRMTIKASLDMGQTWLVNNQLLIDVRLAYGYSCLKPINDSTVLLYEVVRDLYLVKISVGDIIK